MKKTLWVVMLALVVLCFTGCGSGKLETINYQTLTKKIENKEHFILEVMQTGCPACQDFTPRFEKILKEHEITAYALNLTDMTEEDRKAFDSMLNVSSTPTVIFFNDGEEESVTYRIIGAVSNDKIEQKLKAQDYIK